MTERSEFARVVLQHILATELVNHTLRGDDYRMLPLATEHLLEPTIFRDGDWSGEQDAKDRPAGGISPVSLIRFASQLLVPGRPQTREEWLGPIAHIVAWAVADPVANVITMLCFAEDWKRENSPESACSPTHRSNHNSLDSRVLGPLARRVTVLRQGFANRLAAIPTVQLVVVADEADRNANDDLHHSLADFRREYERTQRIHGRSATNLDFRWLWLDIGSDDSDRNWGLACRTILFAHLPRVSGGSKLSPPADPARAANAERQLRDALKNASEIWRGAGGDGFDLSTARDSVADPPPPGQFDTPPSELLEVYLDVRHWRRKTGGGMAIPLSRMTFIVADNAAGKSTFAEALHQFDRAFARDALTVHPQSFEWKHADAEKATRFEPACIAVLRSGGPHETAGELDVLFGTDANLQLSTPGELDLFALSAFGSLKHILVPIYQLYTKLRGEAQRVGSSDNAAAPRAWSPADLRWFASDSQKASDSNSADRLDTEQWPQRLLAALVEQCELFERRVESTHLQARDAEKLKTRIDALKSGLEYRKPLPGESVAALFCRLRIAQIQDILDAEFEDSERSASPLVWYQQLQPYLERVTDGSATVVRIQKLIVEVASKEIGSAIGLASRELSLPFLGDLPALLDAFFVQSSATEGKPNTAQVVASAHAGRLARIIAITRGRWRPLIVDDPALGHDTALAARSIARLGTMAMKAASESWARLLAAPANADSQNMAELHASESHPSGVWLRADRFGDPADYDAGAVAAREWWHTIHAGPLRERAGTGSAPTLVPTAIAQLVTTSYQAESAEIAANHWGALLSSEVRRALESLVPPMWRAALNEGIASAEDALKTGSRMGHGVAVSSGVRALAEKRKRYPAAMLRLFWEPCELPQLQMVRNDCDLCKWRDRAVGALEDLGLGIAREELLAAERTSEGLDGAARRLLTWMLGHDLLPAILLDGSRRFWAGTLSVVYLSTTTGWVEPIGATRLLRIPPLLQRLPPLAMALEAFPVAGGPLRPPRVRRESTLEVAQICPPAEVQASIEPEVPRRATEEPVALEEKSSIVSEVLAPLATGSEPGSEMQLAPIPDSAQILRDADAPHPQASTPLAQAPPQEPAKVQKKIAQGHQALDDTGAEPLQIGIWTRQPMGWPEGYAVFPDPEHHKRLPEKRAEQPAFWRQEILLPLAERLQFEASRGRKEVVLHLRAHLSVAVAVGALVSYRSTWQVRCGQGGEIWELSRPEQRRWRHPEPLAVLGQLPERRGDVRPLHILVGLNQPLSATHRLDYDTRKANSRAVARGVEYEEDVVELEPAGGLSQSSVSSGPMAVAMADSVLRFMARSATRAQGPINLFLAAPVAFAVALGRGLHEMAPVQIWEFDRDETKRYFEAFSTPLPSAPFPANRQSRAR